MRRSSIATSKRAASSAAAPAPPRAKSPTSPHRPSPRIRIVTCAVRGRARLDVEGLRGRPTYATRLEARVAMVHGVRRVSASPLTGNVLVLFDAARLELQHLVRSLARDAAEARRGRPAPGP